MLKNIFITAFVVFCLFGCAENPQQAKTEEEWRELKMARYRAEKARREKLIAEGKISPYLSNNLQVEKALVELKKKAPTGWGAGWNNKQTQVDSLYGEIPWAKVTKPNDSGEKIATDFLKENYQIFQLQPNLADLHIQEVGKVFGDYIVKFSQSFKALPVFNGGIKISIIQNERRHSISSISNNYLPNINISTKPQLSKEEVIAIAKNDVLKNHMYEIDCNGTMPYTGEVVYSNNKMWLSAQEPKLGILSVEDKPELVYRFSLVIERPDNFLAYTVNANTGKVIESKDGIIWC